MLTLIFYQQSSRQPDPDHKKSPLTDDDLDEEEDDGEAEHADQAALLAGVAAPAPALASPHLVAAEQLLPMARVSCGLCRLDLHFTLEWPDCCIVMSSLWVRAPPLLLLLSLHALHLSGVLVTSVQCSWSVTMLQCNMNVEMWISHKRGQVI